MNELEQISVSTAEIVGDALEVSISTTRETKVYVYSLDSILTVMYFPITKLLTLSLLNDEVRNFDNVISVENTQEFDQ